MKKFALILSLVGMVGCQSGKQMEPPKSKDEMFGGHKILNVDCKDETNQVNVHLADRTLITDCYAIKVAMDEHFGGPSLNSKSVEKAK